MAIIQKKVLAYSGTTAGIDVATDWKNWLDTFDVPYLATEVTGSGDAVLLITLGDKVCVDLSFTAGNMYVRMYKVGDTPPSYSVTFGTTYNVILAISNTAIFVTIDSTSSKHFAFLYEDIGLQTYYGSTFVSDDHDTEPRQVQNINLTKYGEVSASYKHTASLNYPTVSGSIDYTDKDLISDGTNSVRDSNYLGCSTVDPHFVYTFSGNNFYALGPNTLVWANNSLSED